MSQPPDLEQRVVALERAVAELTASRTPGQRVVQSLQQDLVLLDALQQHCPEGAVGFAGQLDTVDGPVAWQWARRAEDLVAQDWSSAADRLAALGSPVRLQLLQRILGGTHTTAELADDPDLGTTGQLHHHLRVLMAAGWLQSSGRGRYVIPAPRIVPLLAVLAATE